MHSDGEQTTLNNFIKEHGQNSEVKKVATNFMQQKEWRVVKLGNVCKIVGGGTPKRNNPAYWNGDIVWLTPKELDSDSIKEIYDSERKISLEGLKNSSAQLLPPGTVIFSSRATIGKVAIAGVPLTTNQGFANLICSEKIYNRFLAYYLKYITPEIQKRAGQTTFPEIKKSELKRFQIPLPPVDVQRRVVARLEEITAKIEQAKKIREEALKETEKIMQTALHQIFSKAVEKGWGKKKLESIAFIRKGTINPMDYPDEEFELYSIPAYHTSVEPEIKKGCEIKSSKVLVNPGDCLFGKLNPHVPKIWLVKPYNNRRQIATTEFFPIVSKEKNNNEKWFIPEYIYYVLKSPDFQKRVIHKILGTTASRQRLSPNDILEEEIPLPPFEEQKLVVEHLNRLEEKIRKLKRHQQEVSQKIEKITNAVLEKAFSGRL
jgi:type I restriction enzyme S subunit